MTFLCFRFAMTIEIGFLALRDLLIMTFIMSAVASFCVSHFRIMNASLLSIRSNEILIRMNFIAIIFRP